MMGLSMGQARETNLWSLRNARYKAEAISAVMPGPTLLRGYGEPNSALWPD